MKDKFPRDVAYYAMDRYKPANTARCYYPPAGGIRTRPRNVEPYLLYDSTEYY